ncbi:MULTISPECIES: TonB-dependent receptor [Cellulophaga]|uniref:TonB-dependent receptor n=2 Tax=Cellulophaga TaxID=104264 RepID=F0RAJ5_CELLC|nr:MULTISPECIES: TonB-dependent receptor [Cellulophaga]ADY28388.1 TonB-dependent receptor [Cellulophaga lytica DSM 7489]AIM59450.1 TonB-dependent receptor [Cellulophaga lytica]EWH12818.1 TonB-dependent receptor [Cellulophaga geojensis KL-A]WQG77434.1 TonB-dependent receptor [Cellulophaga lytica]
MKNNYYLILLLLTAFTVTAQNKGGITGQVLDETGTPVIGANVVIQSISIGAVTDENGTYKLDDLSYNTYTITVSYLGYKSIKKSVEIATPQTTLNFNLKEPSFQLDGLVVTAQKREQLNKDVPIAITSYGSDFINNQGTFEYDTFSDYVPGLQIQIQSVNNPGIVVRGITSDSGDSRVEPRVSVFQDGVSISKSRGSVVELFDIERVEVLKGPQGTLFGRGAQIGAMHIIQNKAKNETSASLKTGIGNYNQFLVNGYVNTPLVKDKLFARVAAIYNRRDGYIENLSGGDLNGKETLALRGSLKYMISDNTTFDFIANWQQDTPPGTSFKSGTFAPLGGDLSPNSFADLERGKELGLDRTVYGFTGILKSALNDNWDITSTTAYRKFNSDEAFDADGTAAPVLFFREVAEGEQFSQEVRFNFDNDDKLSGFFGANFFYENGSQAVPFEVNEQSYLALLVATDALVINGVPTLFPNIPNDPGSFGPLAGAPLLPFNKEESINYGENYSGDIFADASYDVTEKLTLTLGLRATLENSNAGLEVINADNPGLLGNFLGAFPNNLFTPTNGRISASETFTSAVGRFAVNYDLSDAVTVFGNVARGRRPNVINVSATEVNVLSDETVWSYELGLKSLMLDNKLQFDINGYYYDYSNFQTTIARLDETDGLVILPNDSGSATALGFEAAMQYQFAKSSSFFANYGYIDASFDDEDSDGNPQQLAGNTFRLTPEHSFSAGFNINPTLSEKVAVFLRPTYTYKSKVFFEETNLPNISQDGYGLLNIRTGITIQDRYEISLYATNVLDEEFIIDAGNTGGAFGIPTFIAGPPAFYGLQLSVKF